jgi:poly(3-hydroxybutyrate) depolymerase
MPRVLRRSIATWRAAAFAAAVAAAGAVHARAAEPALASYNVDIAQTSISGISAGAFMAVQFATAWSSIVKGVGAIAGGPFGCAEGSLATALSTCTGGAPAADVFELIRRAEAWARAGGIDATGEIAAQKIYLFHGYNDTVVARPVSDWLDAWYSRFQGAGSANLFYQTAIGAGHAQVTLGYGGACNANGGEYINRCSYDQAGVILQHIYGALAPRRTGALTGKLVAFGQAEFTAPDKPENDSMDDKGFAFVPASCEAKKPCRLHVVLHGCLQFLGKIGEDFPRHTGYNEWADANDIIVLYPQVRAVAVTALGVTNPEACWDWWGYLDADPTDAPSYLLKSGKQIRAIKAMIDRVAAGTVSIAAPATPQQAAPATLQAADQTDTAIDVVWSAAAGATGYDVFRSDPGNAAFHRIGTIAGLSYADAKLKPATQYQYKVRAAAPTGDGPFSPTLSAATLRRVPKCDDPGNCPVH